MHALLHNIPVTVSVCFVLNAQARSNEVKMLYLKTSNKQLQPVNFILSPTAVSVISFNESEVQFIRWAFHYSLTQQTLYKPFNRINKNMIKHYYPPL